jgi:hypothetical protein
MDSFSKGGKLKLWNRPFIRGILAGLLAASLLVGATFGIGSGVNNAHTKAQAAQDKVATDAFRAKYSISQDTSITFNRMKGTVYTFNHDGQTVLLLGNTWIELNPAP